MHRADRKCFRPRWWRDGSAAGLRNLL